MTTTANTNFKISGNVLQHSQAQTPSASPQIAQPQSTSTPNNILPLAVKPPHSIAGSHQLGLIQNSQPIPPRYQPPPPPPQQMIHSTKPHAVYPNYPQPAQVTAELQQQQQLQHHLKYTTEDGHPRIGHNLYFSDQFKASLPSVPSNNQHPKNQQQHQPILQYNRPGHQLRLPPGAVQHQQLVPPPPPPPLQPSSAIHRLTPAGEEFLASRLTANHLHQQQQHQHPVVAGQPNQDMLKFVRKADSDTSTTTSSNSGRLSVEQPTKQYVQVGWTTPIFSV